MFVGYRTTKNNITVMWETGAGVNNAFTGTELTLESFGKTANDYSFNFLGRMKVGTENIMLEMGTELWLTKVFINDDYKMTSVYVGLRFNF